MTAPHQRWRWTRHPRHPLLLQRGATGRRRQRVEGPVSRCGPGEPLVRPPCHWLASSRGAQQQEAELEPLQGKEERTNEDMVTHNRPGW